MSLSVQDVMVSQVHIIDPAENARNAARLMSKFEVSSLIVSSENDIVGIVTERDIIVSVVSSGQDPEKVTIEEIMSPILREKPETQFFFVGGGNTSFYLEMIRKQGIPKTNFSFVGHVGYFGRSRFLREATVFVNPSVYECCSLSILEAMSSGAAVVASNVGGNPEMIESGKNGILIPPSNSKILAKSIVSLLENENLNKGIGNEARRTVEKSFSSKKCASETYKIYKKTI